MIELDSPGFLFTNQEYALTIIVKNKKNHNNIFRYYYDFCDSDDRICSYIYDIVDIQNLDGFKLIQEGKSEFYQTMFDPFEEKSFLVNVTPNGPTLVQSIYDYFTLYYIDTDFPNPYTIRFQSWIKQDINYKEDKEGSVQDCGEIMQPKELVVPSNDKDGLGFYKFKCCDNIFYPSAECCNNNDCDVSNSDGYCVDGLCMPKNKPSNKLIGNKKILVGYEYSDDDSCEEIPLNNIDNQMSIDLRRLDEYYDHMANLLLDKPSDFVDFELTKIIRVPSGLRGFFDYESGKTEQDILDYLSLKCDINSEDYDIIILPTSVSTSIGLLGQALQLGDGKVVLYTKINSPTLIHEVGHIFGCIDLYTKMGGNLQWASSLYGKHRGNFGEYIYQDNIKDISSKALQVCRGHLGWTDNNNNGIVDIEEW